METIEQITWLTTEALTFLSHTCRPMGYILLTALFAAVSWAFFKQRTIFRRKAVLLPLPLLGTLIMLSTGTLFHDMPHLAFVVHLGMASVLLLSALTIYHSGTLWPLASALSSVIIWLSFGCWFTCGISVSGDWL